MNFKIFVLFILACLTGCTKSDYDIIVVGGGASGIVSAVQSSRMGSKTLLIEETDWLGGMLTSAGVSAMDGNYKMPSGFLNEFRDSLVSRYGSLESLKTGWVSNIMFEPSVGNDILKNIANKEKNLTIFYNSNVKKVLRKDKKWQLSFNSDKSSMLVSSKILIDATELGDIVYKLNLPHSIGMDSRDTYNEKIAPIKSNSIIQDLTYVMILKDYKKNVTITKPLDYNRNEFLCSYDSKECPKSDLKLWPKESLISYGRLPNGKIMINWPINGNDYYVNSIEMDNEKRLHHYQKAKEKSLRFLYFLQTEMGYSNLSIDFNEFSTDDGFPKIPYHRESLRVRGHSTLSLNYITNPYDQKHKLYRTGIGVGDYPVDHHHNAHPNYLELPKLDFYPIPSFSVPIGSLIPKNSDNLIVIEKSISVSNLVNGTTRLQPVVMQIGQASGILAALSISQNKDVKEIKIRDVQLELLKNNGYIQPFADVDIHDPTFISLQKLGACGILKGTGVNIGWENKTLIYPDKNLEKSDLEGLNDFYDLSQYPFPDKLSIENVFVWIKKINNEISFDTKVLEKKWEELGLINFDLKRNILRAEYAVMMDSFLDPFSSYDIDFNGKLINDDQRGNK